MSFVKIATLDQIPDNSVRAFEFEGEQIAIFHYGGRFYATANICTHAYAELHEGFFDTDECSIECPLHGARFSVETGAVLCLPAYQPLQTYAVQIDGNDLLIEI